MEEQPQPLNFTIAELWRIINKQHNLSFLSLLLFIGLVIEILFYVLLPHVGHIQSFVHEALDKNPLGGILLIVLIWIGLANSYRWCISNSDYLVTGLIAIQLSIPCAESILSGQPHYAETFKNLAATFPADPLDITMLFRLIPAIIALPFQNHATEFVYIIFSFLLIKIVLVYSYSFVAAGIEWIVINETARVFIDFVNRLREYRAKYYPILEKRALLTYNQYVIDYHHFSQTPAASPKPSTENTPTEAETKTGTTIHCSNCDALNRIGPIDPNRIYQCAACGEELFDNKQPPRPSTAEAEKTDAALRSALIEKHCRTLEIQPTTDVAKIRKAYRKLMARYHPDMFSVLGKDFEKLAHDHAMLLNNAYRELLDILAVD